MVLWELSENYQSSDNSQIFLNIGTKACTPRFGAGGWVFTLFCRKEGTQRLTGGNKAADSFSGPLVFRAWPYLTRLCQQHIILNGFSPCPLALRLQKVGVGFCPKMGCGATPRPVHFAGQRLSRRPDKFDAGRRRHKLHITRFRRCRRRKLAHSAAPPSSHRNRFAGFRREPCWGR